MAKQAHDLAPEDSNIIDTLAEAFFAAGERRQSVHFEKEALKRKPGNEFFRQQLARFAKDE
jgi:hypothetical protein